MTEPTAVLLLVAAAEYFLKNVLLSVLLTVDRGAVVRLLAGAVAVSAERPGPLVE